MSALSPPNESRGSSLIVSQWITVSIASLLVFLRIYARAVLRKIAGADDWTIVIALGFALAQSILTKSQLDNGFGRHIQYIQPDQIRNFLFVTTVIEILHTIGTFLVRVSVCLFVLRLVPSTHREFYKYTYMLVAFFAVISIATFLLILLGCIPIQAISAVMDLLCVGLPIFFLRNLQAKLSRKISIFVLLGLGLFTAACAILRTLYIDFVNEDFTWHIALVGFWAGLEQNIGIIVASLPAAHQLHTMLLEKFFPNFANDHNNNYPRFRSLKAYTSSSGGDSDTRNGSHNNNNDDEKKKTWLDGQRGSSSCLPGELPPPSSPTKKEPRMDYDSATLNSSPKLEQAATNEECLYFKQGGIMGDGGFKV